MAMTTVADIENLTGLGNDDILAGDLRNNTIKGGGGDDKIYGGPNPADADTESDNLLTNIDMLYGDGGNDMIFGGVGDDTLRGGAGDDMLHGGPGIDMFYGGAGSDLIYADTTDTLIVGDAMRDDNLDDGDDRGAMMGDVDTVSFARVEDEIIGPDAANRWTLGEASSNAYGIENVIGTQGDDFIGGDANDNVIEGGEGADNMDGGGPAPTDGAVPAGMIGDTLSYESSDDWVRVTLNDDAAATASRGHASGDTATGFENIRGSAHDDDLGGNVNNNHLWGLAGDDEIEGAGGNDTIEGSAGEDELNGGYTDSDVATGNQGNSEANTLSYASSDAGVTVNLVTASASDGHAQGDTIVTYEELSPTDDDLNNEIDVATFANVTGSMYADHLTGNHWDNQLAGGAGDDTLRGGASDAGDRTLTGAALAAALRGDVLVGGPGADDMDGGEDRGEMNDMVMVPDPADNNPADGTDMISVRASVDWAVYKHAMEGVTVDLSTNMGTGGEAMGDTLRNIELVWGSEKDDMFIAGPGGDIIEGDGGSDTVSYEASEMGVTVDLDEDTTTVPVGTDDDEPTFGADPDPLAVTAPATLLTGVPRLNAMDEVLTNADGENAENEDTNPNVNGAAGDRLRSIENLTGSNMADDLDGDGNPNVLKGMGGNDELTGDGGADMLYGGDGDDMLEGGAGDDMLKGGAGNDDLNGGEDDDTLTGGAGDDDLTGGGGDDTFVFSPMDGAGSDIIIDWTTGTGDDTINLSAYGLTEEQVITAITIRGGQAVINLEAHGGGRITLEGVD